MEENQEEANMTKRAYDTFASFGLNGQEAKVEDIKAKAAQLWDVIDDISIEPNAAGGRSARNWQCNRSPSGGASDRCLFGF